MMADGYNGKRRGERFQNSTSNPTAAYPRRKYPPVENAINDQCHAFLFDYKVYRPSIKYFIIITVMYF